MLASVKRLSFFWYSNPRLVQPAESFPAFVAADFGVGRPPAHLFLAGGGVGAGFVHDSAAILSVGLDSNIDAELRVCLLGSFVF